MSPVTRNEITDEWIAERREALQRYGQPARKSATGNAIEVKSLPDNQWCYIMLPRGQREFESPELRDEVFEKLVGRSRAPQ